MKKIIYSILLFLAAAFVLQLTFLFILLNNQYPLPCCYYWIVLISFLVIAILGFTFGGWIYYWDKKAEIAKEKYEHEKDLDTRHKEFLKLQKPEMEEKTPDTTEWEKEKFKLTLNAGIISEYIKKIENVNPQNAQTLGDKLEEIMNEIFEKLKKT